MLSSILNGYLMSIIFNDLWRGKSPAFPVIFPVVTTVGILILCHYDGCLVYTKLGISEVSIWFLYKKFQRWEGDKIFKSQNLC